MESAEEITQQFAQLPSKEALYQHIIEWGKKLPPFNSEWKTEENRVSGCQSLMHLHTTAVNGKIYFYAASDALISAGLAALLIKAYSGETPETVLLKAPKFLDEIGIPAALTPGRANGLASLYLKMKQEALKHLVALKKDP